MPFLRYTPEIEQIDDDEPELFRQIADTFRRMAEQVAGREGRAVRPSHAKATALLKGELHVADGLPSELAQGLAAGPGRYDAVARFAQGPGELLHDRVSVHRGMAIKLLGVPGLPIHESAEPGTQDFVLAAHATAFINSDARRFLANLRAGVSNAPSLPEGVKFAVSRVARGAEAALEAVGLETKTLGFFGHPRTHPLSDAYFSQAPMRWGDYVAKVGAYPTPETLDALGDVAVDTGDDPDAFRTAMLAHFAGSGAEFELKVQLATDLRSTPVEDAAREWPEQDNPYRTVARLILPAQTAWSEERDGYAERLSFRPANSIVAHRPLGQVMRARLFTYPRIADWRRDRNGLRPTRPDIEPPPA